MKKENILICFCKHPEPGLVKSRLAKAVGVESASNIYKSLLKSTLVNIKQTNVEAYLYCHPDTHHPLLKQHSNKFNICLKSQANGNLGSKMFQAMSEHINENTNVVLIGSDSFEVNTDYILRAFEALNNNYDIVLGPALDGGYALIGANKIDESVFQNICWSTTNVLNQTKENISCLGWKYKCLAEVRDLDTIEDYEYFTTHEKYKHLFSSQ